MNHPGACSELRELGARQRPALNLASEVLRWSDILALLILGFAVSSAQAQLYTGSFTGVVSDSSGAVVPLAKVTLLDQERGITVTTTTDDAGRYLFRSVQPSTYTISVEADHFQAQRNTGIALSINQNVSVDFALKIGAAAIVVDVQASTVQLGTEDATTGQLIDRKFINELPLVTRNVLDLIALAPGVNPPNGGSSSQLNGLNFISDGGRNGTADVLIDGVSATNYEQNSGIQTVVYQPSVDAVREFKVQQSNFSSEFGFSGGTVVNLITRSGTNQLHGSLYEFNRNSALEANNFFNNANGAPIPPLSRNDFGGSIGGPIRRNKTFFFFDYEGVRQSVGASYFAGVPTAQERNGDFGILCQANGGTFNASGQCSAQAGQLYDPYNGTFNSNTGAVNRSIFIPFNNLATYTSQALAGQSGGRQGAGNLIDPAAQKFFQFFPNPTNTNARTLSTLYNNYFVSGTNPSSNNQFDIKIDQHFGDRNALSVKYSQQKGVANTLNCYGSGNPADPCFTGPSYVSNHLVAINDTHVFSPSTVLTVSYGYSRTAPNSPGPLAGSNVNPLAVLGLQGSPLGTSGIRAFPNVFLGNYTAPGIDITGFQDNLGTQGFSILREGGDSHTLLGGVSWLHGKHEFKFGAEGRLRRINFSFPFWNGGVDGFNFAGTSGSNQDPTTGGDSLASFLIGVYDPTFNNFNGGYPINTTVSTQNFQAAGYAQDNYRFTRKLTFNIGLRYELTLPRTERNNRAEGVDTNVLTGLSVPLTPGAAPTAVRGGEVFATSGNRTTYGTDYKDFGPRFGFAYQLPDTFVVRGGYGIYFSTSRSGAAGIGGIGLDGYSSFSVPLPFNFGDQATPFSTFSNQYPFGLTLPTGNTLGPQTSIGGAASGADRTINQSIPYEQSWTLGVQKQLPWKILIDATYVGKKGTHLYYGGAENLDFLPERIFRNTPTNQVASTLLNFVSNPFFNPNGGPFDPGCDRTRYICNSSTNLATSPVVQAFQLQLPFPQFASLSTDPPPVGNSIYHSGQFRLEKPFANGLQVLLTYTVSKSIDNTSGTSGNISFLGAQATGLDDPNRRNLERSVSSFDVPQIFTASYVYELPVGRKRHFLGNANRILDGFIGGWQSQGIITFTSGTPLLPSLSAGSAIPFPTFAQRPDLNGALACNTSFSDPFTQTYFANPNVLATPANYTLGTAPRTISSCRNPGVKNADIAVSKQFSLARLREGSHLEFRFETFNTLNRVQFGQPNTSVNSGQLGVITSQANLPRQVQLGLRFDF